MNFPIEKHLLPLFQDDNALLLLQKQIAKDFAVSQVDFPESFSLEVFSLDNLQAIVQEKLVQIMAKGERQTLQLLYTIDLPEKKFLSILQNEDVAKSLCYLILEREAQKIYFRLKFS